ncbi:MAG TPA: hypothetical protein PKX46_06740 [Clostridia bacterium]|nr:hypothetical protein [Clostridia bacterium]
MKIFQILNSICHWDATGKHPTIESTQGLYAPDIVFIEAPDYVFEGWGYDAEAEGDERFIQPTPPEHWLYDPETGTFYPDPDNPAEGWEEPEEKGAPETKALLVEIEGLQKQVADLQAEVKEKDAELSALKKAR